MANYQSQSNKKSVDPLPYIIVFGILILITLGVFTWFLSVFYKDHACTLYPNIWCSDNWTCSNSCPGGRNPMGQPVNACFDSIGATGLSSCLFGPNAAGATACFTAPTGGAPIGGTGFTCTCSTGMLGVASCFNNCAINLHSTNQEARCCCNDPNNPACAVSADGKTGTGLCASTS